MAYLALFVALGGTGAWAASSIVSRGGTIAGCYAKDGSLRVVGPRAKCRKGEKRLVWSQKGPKGARGATGLTGPRGPQGPATGPAGGDLDGTYPNPFIRRGAVSSNDVADNALTGDDIDESKLGKVPTAASADAVGGLTADRAARTASIDVILPENSSTGFVGRNLEVPGFGSLFLSCPPNPSATAGQVAYTSSVDTAQTAWVDHPGASPNSAVLSRNGQLSVATAAGGTDMATFHVVKTGGASAWIVGSRRVYKNVILNQWRCEVAAQAVTTAP